MEINNLILTKKEYNLIEEILFVNSIIFEILFDGTNYKIVIDDTNAEILSELIKDAYVFEGFDIYYNANFKGKIYEQIIDKLSQIGW